MNLLLVGNQNEQKHVRQALDTSGSKPTLVSFFFFSPYPSLSLRVQRLDAALRKEEEADALGQAAGGVDSTKDDSSKGNKKWRRNDALEDASKDKEDEGKSKKEKLVTMTKKNGAVLDPFLPCHIKSNFHVLQKAEEIYTATLNQTNLGDNNNKFYVIQALAKNRLTFVWSLPIIVISCVAGAGLAGYIYYKYRLRSYMDSKIMAIMSQYMPLDNHANEIESSQQHSTAL